MYHVYYNGCLIIMKKICFIVLSLIFLTTGNSFALNPSEVLGYVPQPKLIEPTGEQVDLTGKVGLTFSWGKHIGMNGLGKYYDFKLYKGTDIVEANLIFKERVTGDKYKLVLPVKIFEDKALYTWSLKLCYKIRGKSTRSLAAFQVVKK